MRECLEKGGFIQIHCRYAPAERETLDLYSQERGPAVKNPGEPSVDLPCSHGQSRSGKNHSFHK